MENKIKVQNALEYLLRKRYEQEVNSYSFIKALSFNQWMIEKGVAEFKTEKQEEPHFAKFPGNHMGLFETDYMKQQLSELEKYEAVNATKTLEELAEVILSFADENGMIEGRERKHNAKLMANNCKTFQHVHPTTLTRMFGIRQQAVYILSMPNSQWHSAT